MRGYIAPTGSGKSAAFWGAGLIRGGLTLVVSPLRSLIADQYRRLEDLGVPVRIWNSDVRDSYKAETLRLICTGWAGVVYTTPESLKGKALSQTLGRRVNLAVVDEAHCTLKDRGFRLCYAWLGSLLDTIDPQVRFACTATLPAHDRAELTHALRLTDPVQIALPVARSNLAIRIINRDPDTLASILNRHQGEAGIIFCATVKTAKGLYARLESQGRKVTLYHGKGMSAKTKKANQDAFMSGKYPVAIVTDAFLLGIDKADLRFTVHYDHPKSIEDWCQGFGRAGRDGLPATVYGAFQGSTQGRESRRFLIDSNFPPVDDLRRVWEYLFSAPGRDETQTEIAEHVLGRRGRYSGGAILTTLRRHHLARAEPHPNDGRRRVYFGSNDFDAVDWVRYLAEHQSVIGRFEQLCDFVGRPEAEIPAAIGDYFGCDPEGDSDLAEREAIQATENDQQHEGEAAGLTGPSRREIQMVID